MPVGLLLAALAILIVVISQEGPDRTVTGRVTERQSHRICVGRSTGPDICVRADSPESIGAVSTGDCIRVLYSAEEVLISLDRVDRGCEDVKPGG